MPIDSTGQPDLSLLPRTVVAILCGIGIWLPGFRRPVWTKLALTLLLGFAVVMWDPFLLKIGGALAAIFVAIGLLRRRWPKLDQFLARAAGDIAEKPRTLRASSNDFTALPHARTVSLAWCAAGLLVLGASLAILEVRQPYYFCQDDMMVGTLPLPPQDVDGVFHGHFRIPQWHGDTLMGSLGESEGGSMFYPPAYLAYPITCYVLRNPYAYCDVSAILHLVGGYLILFVVLRKLGIRPAWAAIGSLSMYLSGSMLIMGRGWSMFIEGAFWTPILMYAMVRLTRGPVGWRWALCTGLAIGALFQVGFAQLWLSVLLLIALAAVLMWITRQLPSERLVWLTSAVVLGAGLALPIMYQQWQLTRDMNAGERGDAGVVSGLLDFFLPYPLAHAEHPVGWGGLNSRYMGEMYYFGTLFAVLPLVGAVAIFTSCVGRRVWGANIWLAMALIITALAMGGEGGFWPLLSRLPILSIVNHYPFRLLPFLTLFCVMAGGIVIDRLLDPAADPVNAQRGAHRRLAWEIGLTVPTAALLIWHVWFSRASFYEYGFRPNQPLTKPLADLLQAHNPHPAARVMPWCPLRSSSPDYRDSMMLNLPHMDGIFSFCGYDPLIESKENGWVRARNLMARDPRAASVAYGVRWHVVSRLCEHPDIVEESTGANQALEKSVPMLGMLRQLPGPGVEQVAFQGQGLPLSAAMAWPDRFKKETLPKDLPPVRLQTPTVTVYDMGPVNPLAFPQGHPEQPLRITPTESGVDVQTGVVRAGENVVVNFLWYPHMQAEIDGHQAGCVADSFGRILVSVPADAGGSSTLHVRYAPDWSTGVAIGAALTLASASLTLIGTRWRMPITRVLMSVDDLVLRERSRGGVARTNAKKATALPDDHGRLRRPRPKPGRQQRPRPVI